MRTTIIAGLTAIALLSPSLSFAEETPSPQGATEQEHWRPSPEDLKAFTDARVAGLKAGLQLTPDQEKKWPVVEQAIRDMAKSRQERMAAWREHSKGDKVDSIARIRARADVMTQRAAELRKLADAAEPLYQSLSDDQKHRLHFLVRMAMGHHGGGWAHGGWGHHRGGGNG
ncbi:MAG: Spy/CpxP family protein refolding chaperone [Rhodomicrobium sp.]